MGDRIAVWTAHHPAYAPWGCAAAPFLFKFALSPAQTFLGCHSLNRLFSHSFRILFLSTATKACLESLLPYSLSYPSEHTAHSLLAVSLFPCPQHPALLYVISLGIMACCKNKMQWCAHGVCSSRQKAKQWNILFCGPITRPWKQSRVQAVPVSILIKLLHSLLQAVFSIKSTVHRLHKWKEVMKFRGLPAQKVKFGWAVTNVLRCALPEREGRQELFFL